jgi:hypothetical protein
MRTPDVMALAWAEEREALVGMAVLVALSPEPIR